VRRSVAIVHDGYVPSYRVPLYEALGRIDDLHYVVFHSEPPPESAHVAAHPPFGFDHRHVPQHMLRVVGRRVYHQRLVREIVSGYGAVVLGAWLRYMSNHAIRLAFQAAGRPVVLWGHGGHHLARQETGWPQPLTRACETAKDRLARSADAYVAYTQTGARELVATGVEARRVYALQNTIDMNAERELHARTTAVGELQIRATLGVEANTPVLVFIGRFLSEKRIQDLVGLARTVNAGRAVPARFVLIGDGPLRRHVEALAADAEHVSVLGPLDSESAACWLACATAVVVPGSVGLVVNHAFAHGVPIVTSADALHGPEIEYVQHGRNGLVVDDVAAALGELIDSPGKREHLAAGARATATRLRLDSMVDTFDTAVRAALNGACS